MTFVRKATTAHPMHKTTSAVQAPLASQAKYTNAAILLHWWIAVLMAINVGLGLFASHVGPDWERFVVDLHKSIGLTVLGLVLIRIVWRFGHRPPRLPLAMSRVEKIAAHVSHALLYVVMVALPLSGWIHDSAWSAASTHPMKLFGVIPWFRLSFVTSLSPNLRENVHTLFGMIHTWLGWGLYALVGLHILAALKHQWIDHDKIMRRMGFN